MRFQNSLIPTLKEDPADAEVVSHKLMIRAGMIKKLASGIYTVMPYGWRSMEKLAAVLMDLDTSASRRPGEGSARRLPLLYTLRRRRVPMELRHPFEMRQHRFRLRLRRSASVRQPERRQKLGHAARETVRRDFAPSGELNKNLELYRQLIG